jgi:hypothetical protein
MNGEGERGTIESIGVVNLILGAWLIISPWILGYTTSAAKWNQTILGIVGLVRAGLRALAPRQQWLSFLNGLAAIWLIISPWILNYQQSAAYWNQVIVAIVVGVLAFWNSSLTVGHIGRGRPHYTGA